MSEMTPEEFAIESPADIGRHSWRADTDHVRVCRLCGAHWYAVTKAS
jgi:hypothetical protein